MDFSHPLFGTDVDLRNYLVDALNRFSFTNSNVDTKIILTDNYEDRFGIYPHLSGNKNRPMASVAFHSCEDMLTHSLLAESMRVYEKKKIKEIFGISYTEYMSLPTTVASLMRDICEEVISRKTTEANNADNLLKNAMNGVIPKNMK